MVEHVVTNLWGWKYLGHFKTKQAKGQKLAKSVRQERQDREKMDQRRNKQSEDQEIYSAEVSSFAFLNCKLRSCGSVSGHHKWFNSKQTQMVGGSWLLQNIPSWAC